MLGDSWMLNGRGPWGPYVQAEGTEKKSRGLTGTHRRQERGPTVILATRRSLRHRRRERGVEERWDPVGKNQGIRGGHGDRERGP